MASRSRVRLGKFCYALKGINDPMVFKATLKTALRETLCIVFEGAVKVSFEDGIASILV